MIVQKDVTLHFVGGLRFSCTSCGKCCNNDWDIPVTAAKVPGIEATELYTRKVKEGYLPLRVISSESTILGTRDTGECVFLGRDLLCELHAEHGATSKPVACQLFPLNLVQTPGGLYVSASFACPAVLAGIGGPLEEQREWLSELVRHAEEIPPLVSVSAPIHLTQSCEISWATYLRLEERLLSLLGDDISPESFIRWAALLLENVNDFGGFKLEEFDPSVRPVILEHALELFDIFARVVVGIIEVDSDMEEREALIASLLAENAARSKKTGVNLPAFGLYRPPSGVTRGLILQFLRSQFEGKRLLTGRSVVSRLLCFGTSLAILWYYLEAQARGTGTLHLSFEQLEKAFSLVEENILTHSSDLDPFFDKYESTLFSFFR